MGIIIALRQRSIKNIWHVLSLSFKTYNVLFLRYILSRLEFANSKRLAGRALQIIWMDIIN